MNHLSGETSPYLLQHARNPVDWHPWTDLALQKAKQENKLMIISIGYTACHWCHVMEKESFEDQDIARYTNEFFVSVKVDREERPDIDQVYMLAAYAVSGRGGWPLNVIALPDGRPVYAGTYFRKSDWFYLLRELSATWKNNPEEMIRQAESIQRRMKAMEAKPASASPPAPLLQEGGVTERFRVLKPRLDFEYGGTAGAPKFPMPGLLQLILHLARLSGDSEIQSFIRLTLEKMANGGIFDHLGGGFSRYSTDNRWHVPHFEKMLYDNAQLVSLYSSAYLFSSDPLYREVVVDTLQFIERELTSPEGLFYSSIDADSEGMEGAFYTWTLDEVNDVLGEKAGEFVDFYKITEKGNWENGLNVLWNPDCRTWGETTRKSRDILFRIREKRIRPALDNKMITSWSSMMISGYLDAYRAFGEGRFLEKAVNAAAMLAKGWREKGRLSRLQDHESRITDYGLREASHEKRESKAFLDDYAFTISAFISLYQCVFDPSWLDLAEQMVNHVLSHFRDDATGLFWFASDEDAALISRSMELSDNVIPSSNAVMAHNLFFLGHLLGREPWIGFAEKMSARLSHQVDSDPSFYAFWADLHLRILKRPFEVSIVGPEWKSVLQKFQRHYLPDVIFSGGTDDGGLEILKGKAVEGKTVIYVCRDKTCSEPLTDPGDVLRAFTDDEIEPH